MEKWPGPQPHETRSLSLLALRRSFMRIHPTREVDDQGYVRNVTDNLVANVRREDFEADLRSGDGNELKRKFKAVHSSSALAVNVFGPFRTCISELTLPGKASFTRLAFERKCPHGVSSSSPNLDLLLDGPEGVVGIESKLTEHLSKHRAAFSPKYHHKIRDERRDSAWFREMCRLEDNPRLYCWLDAAQLVKHAFGLAYTFPGQPVSLLYLFWEPCNAGQFPLFAKHRHEIDAFSESVGGSRPAFRAMSYGELLSDWLETAPSWLANHIGELRTRYQVDL